MRVVVDTNVLVSALLHPTRGVARLLDRHLLDDDRFTWLVDARIVAEYRSVLVDADLGIDPDEAEELLQVIDDIAVFIDDPTPIDAAIHDPGDLPFLEVAVAGGAHVVITGNKKHFRGHGDFSLLGPGELLRLLEDADDA